MPKSLLTMPVLPRKHYHAVVIVSLSYLFNTAMYYNEGMGRWGVILSSFKMILQLLNICGHWIIPETAGTSHLIQSFYE